MGWLKYTNPGRSSVLVDAHRPLWPDQALSALVENSLRMPSASIQATNGDPLPIPNRRTWMKHAKCVINCSKYLVKCQFADESVRFYCSRISLDFSFDRCKTWWSSQLEFGWHWHGTAGWSEEYTHQRRIFPPHNNERAWIHWQFIWRSNDGNIPNKDNPYTLTILARVEFFVPPNTANHSWVMVIANGRMGPTGKLGSFHWWPSCARSSVPSRKMVYLYRKLNHFIADSIFIWSRSNPVELDSLNPSGRYSPNVNEILAVSCSRLLLICDDQDINFT